MSKVVVEITLRNGNMITCNPPESGAFSNNKDALRAIEQFRQCGKIIESFLRQQADMPDERP